tara:strand:- start:2002 stop:2967 length:966 start_codon:yes stop_codon:yes gene_type:complete
LSQKKIFVAGHKGMVGSAIYRSLSRDNNNIISIRNRDELDLLNQLSVNKFFSENIFDEIYIAAAKVGGIHANSFYPANFIYENLTIQSNIIHAAHVNNVNKILFLGSSCIYPKYADQPMQENSLLSGYLESTNAPYAIAKIAGIKLCEAYNKQYGRDYRSVMPTNLYGPGDNYHPKNSHVIPSLIRRFFESKKKALKSISIWGTGKPFREFLHVDDMADASIFIMNLEKKIIEEKVSSELSHINIGSGKEITIKDLACLISDISDFKGSIHFDESKPDGTPRKLLDTNLAQSLGWSSKINLNDGLKDTYLNFAKNYHQLHE